MFTTGTDGKFDRTVIYKDILKVNRIIHNSAWVNKAYSVINRMSF